MEVLVLFNLSKMFGLILGTGNSSNSYNHVNSGWGLFIYTGGIYRNTNYLTINNCQCDDSRCGDDGF